MFTTLVCFNRCPQVLNGMEPSTSIDMKNEKKRLIEETEHAEVTKRKCVGDLLALSLTNACILTSYDAIRDLETSLNRDTGIVSLGCFNLGVVASTISSPLLFNKICPRHFISVACLIHAMFVSSHFYPTYFILIPTFLLMGYIFGPTATATGIHLTRLSLRYAAMSNLDNNMSMLSLFNGIYFTFQQSSYVWGNLISSLLLYEVDLGESGPNRTDFTCGIHYCPLSSQLPVVKPVELRMVHILLLILLGCDVLAFFVSLAFIGKSEDDENMNQIDDPNMDEKKSYKTIIRETLDMMKNRNVLAMIPLFMLTGVGETLVSGIFPLVSYIFYVIC